jgi:hypothetical protein
MDYHVFNPENFFPFSVLLKLENYSVYSCLPSPKFVGIGG